MKNNFVDNLSRFHLWIDVLLLNLAYVTAGSSIIGSFAAFSSDHHSINLLLMANLVWIFCVHVFTPYTFTMASYDSCNHLRKHLLAVVFHLLLLEMFLYFGQQWGGIKENVIFVAFQFFAVFTVIAHIAVITLLRILRRAGYLTQRYAIVGDDFPTEAIARFTRDHLAIGYKFCGNFNYANKPEPLKKLEHFMECERLDFVYCSLSEMDKEQVAQVLRLAERTKTQVRLIPDLHGFPSEKLLPANEEGYPIFHFTNKPLSRSNEQLVKRTFDIIFATMVLLLGLPVFVLISLLVKISSAGPIFFVQERTGRWGKKFRIIKYRTMYVNAETYGLQHSLGTKDPRITPLGSFLRRTRLDELPQFVNVLIGDMSVVGPRPLYKYDVEMLMDQASHKFLKSLTVRPGITSIGQIKVGYATNSSENLHRLRYDLQYLNTYSLAKDIYLIFLTIMVVFLGKGR